ncbi:MAG: beta-lactamase family protein [Deltaproteobacteria bacterium]|nr:beta-lactamase family protein [Deltaproteobacteria bacterium]
MPKTNLVDQVLERAVETKEVPGVVGMAATDTGIIYEGAFGKRELGKDPPMTIDSVVWIASMTKAITATAAMQLMERGKIKLEQDASDIIPELASPKVLEGFDASGKPRLRPAKRPITVKHLLTHTAGFGYEMWSSMIQECQKAESIPGIITCQNKALGLPLLFDPGERWEYGINIDWVGKIVERVSGQTLDRYLDQNILGPLGIKDTSFKITPSMRTRLVPIHQRVEDGSLQPTSTEIPQEPEFFMGGGGLYGTAPDYLTFAQMILHRGTYKGAQVLRPETVALMSQNHIGDIKVGMMKTAAPPLSNDVILYPGMALKWGLSFLINTAQTPEGRSAGSLAWAGLANTFFWIDPTQKITGVFLTQVLPFFDQKCIKLFNDFETAIYKSA